MHSSVLSQTEITTWNALWSIPSTALILQGLNAATPGNLCSLLVPGAKAWEIHSPIQKYLSVSHSCGKQKLVRDPNWSSLRWCSVIVWKIKVWKSEKSSRAVERAEIWSIRMYQVFKLFKVLKNQIIKIKALRKLEPKSMHIQHCTFVRHIQAYQQFSDGRQNTKYRQSPYGVSDTALVFGIFGRVCPRPFVCWTAIRC